jgi:plasmid stabilization system protein ParE
LTWAVRFSPAAEADIGDAVDWYEARSPGLGARLLSEIGALEARLAANPLQFPPLYRGTRRASLRRFPYILVFRVTDEDVGVLAVFHTSRDPRRWRSRL